MVRGRGSASRGGVLAAVLLVAFLVMMTSAPPVAEAAATYMVGDFGGWKFNVAGWAKGRTFRAGDWLVFNYNRAVHDVAVVDAAAYRSCVVPRGARVLRSGRDRVKLGRGTHYFVCTVRGHCQAGMKVAVRAVYVCVLVGQFVLKYYDCCGCVALVFVVNCESVINRCRELIMYGQNSFVAGAKKILTCPKA
ncbi:hypothetical protein EJB05_19865 [Eragrostis curvula]|uniref:Plantacyanin n=1 Tax=Eragrostis curvula TaxID=38414 RepID=A0A5J9UWX3_9POAL|nr:hypothetical protein EJB05_19865 [Eragrostis curvula]